MIVSQVRFLAREHGPQDGRARARVPHPLLAEGDGFPVRGGRPGVSCCLRRAGSGSVRRVPGTPPVPGEAASPDEVIAGLRAANARLRDLLAERDEHIAQLSAQVAQVDELQALVAELRAQVADLAARVTQNSTNSSKPPSSDGLGKPAPKSLRNKTGRRPGRPKGQPGATMKLADHPDHVIRHEPPACRTCGTGLSGGRQTGLEPAGNGDPAGHGGGHRAPDDRAGMSVLRAAHQGGRSGRGHRAGAVRAAGRGAGHPLVARPVPVPGPGLRRAGRDVRLRLLVPQAATHRPRSQGQGPSYGSHSCAANGTPRTRQRSTSLIRVIRGQARGGNQISEAPHGTIVPVLPFSARFVAAHRTNRDAHATLEPLE